MNLINNVMNKHHCPTQDKGMSPKRKEDNKKDVDSSLCLSFQVSPNTIAIKQVKAHA